ncbi:GNAT family N-acetyltransferase [Lacticaseibacillus manihotivorans]|uniref:Acetyltransferase, GNAT family n=2 Tax=Lacticaseibacillus manihotivorans TaxID=88233 RepID=A0A0R1Q9I9_9LACO|nr:GNAT family protein [Lacticaseibacillus manihotivorans]KRL41213.1 acetyltransferase, GNAT family [Lacticaseibacillus manihotivorans DSM 13343 = JCM 12514]QFQ90329.1 GNAT family N-acetyltransferase [Lacticaseibacillus manihotivorans]
MSVAIRPLQAKEGHQFWQLAYSDPKAEWIKFNGPYFRDVLPTEAEFMRTLEDRWLKDPLRQVITLNNELVGSMSAYYEDGSLKRWLDVGIVVYKTDLWGQHIGRKALTQWVAHLFETFDLPHIGFTTWSGNPRMMRLGEAVGMQLEGRIRQVRYWQGQYYDSMKYGVLREEWTQHE